uniref:Ribonuclease Z n=1 Tax=Platysiphonia delicata TaxID=2006979 RepID=A0A1Z1M0B6_9FLOR|nr:ribonuclease Z [Platysiphonia delicata]ARW59507.1 ribonuclease Z [Platysiphonia delicata]
MQIYCLYNSIGNLKYSNTSFISKFFSFKDLWIFNCCDGCQYFMTLNKYKLNNLSKIIITDMHINNISGLIGLLSSLNLIGRTKPLHIYASKSLTNYLNLSKKYSRTNFCYVIYVHILKTGLIINHNKYRVHNFLYQFYNQLIITRLEKPGTFMPNKAKNNCLIPGPLYGNLKKGLEFIYPDGSVLSGSDFIDVNLFGFQLSFFLNCYYRRLNNEVFIGSNTIFY